MTADSTPRAGPSRPTRVVGIGASAGGLEALQQFLAQVPADSGLAFMVVQHLDPTQRAMLAQLLQRVSRLPVREATEGMRIEADQVYVIPPNAALTLRQRAVHLQAPTEPRGLRRPIDALFESLAEEQGDRAVGIVLSGMGSDGTAGLRTIRARGGLTLAQEPASAQFDSMPQTAIATGCVDAVAAPDRLPGVLLARLAGREGLQGRAPPPPPAGTGGQAQTAAEAAEAVDAEPGTDGDAQAPTTFAPDGLAAILDLLRRRGLHDFRLYKPSTLTRRIERRIAIHRLPSMAAYESLLRSSPQELSLLFKELLIGVTSFFRDRSVWQSVRDDILPRLLDAHPDGHRLRAWVAGCSTGEEAYTLAMTFREAQDALPARSQSSLQIFATDLSRDAIDVARRGRFALSAADEMSPTRLERFFTRHDDGYQVGTTIREMIVFAPHDLIVDPPFTKLDLLSCRNLLIYLTAPLQRRLLPLFHYSLRPGGLLLGSSETIGRHEDLFEPVDLRNRIYRRRETGRAIVVPEFPFRLAAQSVPSTPRHPHPTQEPLVHDPPAPPMPLQGAADQLLLQELSPPAVLVNQRGDIIYINGRTGRYLEPAAGKANWNVHVMAREALRQPLDSAMRQALAQPGSVEVPGLAFDADGRQQLVDLSVRALHGGGPLDGLMLIVFREAVAPARRRRSRSAAARELESELQQAREEAQALREEMRASQEELQASNEELQSTNEELQSTNEELTSSKEEMQSMNEELQAVNAELQSKLDDLALAQSDMSNLLNSTDIATLFLDRELNVRRFTDKARKIISLRESDLGRPLSDLTSQLEYPQLQDDIHQMLRTLRVCEREIHSRDGHWYAVRVMPYRTNDNRVQGAVITFVDITTAKALEARLRETR